MIVLTIGVVMMIIGFLGILFLGSSDRKMIESNSTEIAKLRFDVKELKSLTFLMNQESSDIKNLVGDIYDNTAGRMDLWKRIWDLSEALGYEYKEVDDKITITTKKYVKKPRGKK